MPVEANNPKTLGVASFKMVDNRGPCNSASVRLDLLAVATAAGAFT
jgi:hypothetical protein